VKHSVGPQSALRSKKHFFAIMREEFLRQSGRQHVFRPALERFMSVLVEMPDPAKHACTGVKVKSGNICALVLIGFCIWTPRPSVAESAPESHTSASLRPTPISAAGADDDAGRRGVSGTPKTRARVIDDGTPSALNLLGIRYAKGQGVKRNPGLAMRFFLRSAMQGYTPAMANIGTLYEIGATGHRNLGRAYAWVRAALAFGVSQEIHDTTVLKLGMIAAQLGSDNIGGAEMLAETIAARVVETCECSPGQETELASDSSV
jgi:hypothetical protein